MLDGIVVPPSGGSLEIGNTLIRLFIFCCPDQVPPSGGSLEIGNIVLHDRVNSNHNVPPSGGSLEIGNKLLWSKYLAFFKLKFPLRGDP